MFPFHTAMCCACFPPPCRPQPLEQYNLGPLKLQGFKATGFPGKMLPKTAGERGRRTVGQRTLCSWGASDGTPQGSVCGWLPRSGGVVPTCCCEPLPQHNTAEKVAGGPLPNGCLLITTLR